MEDITAQLSRLEQLRANGTLSTAEFKNLKDKLISDGLYPNSDANSSHVKTSALRRRKLLAWVIPTAAILLVFFAALGLPLLNEGAANECSALEQNLMRQASKNENADSVTNAFAAGFVALLQKASDGALASSQIKHLYPSLPPMAGCTVAYYRLLFHGSLSGSQQLLAGNADETPNAGLKSSENSLGAKGLFAAADPGLPASRSSLLVNYPAQGPKGMMAIGQTEQTLETVNGPLIVKWKVGGKDPDHSETVYWNGKEEDSDVAANIKGAFPTNGKAELVVISDDAGGNCCLPAALLLDMTGPSPFLAGDTGIVDDAVSIQKRGPYFYAVSGKAAGETDKLGDPVNITVLYDAKRKQEIRSSYDGKTDYLAFVGRHPDDLLGDQAARQ